jgi:translocator protein
MTIFKNRLLLDLAGWVVICFCAMYTGAYFAAGAVVDWYPALAKPAWTPPDWLFAPVWTLLYLMMALAAWLVWRQGGMSRVKVPITFFLVQLILNVLWTYLFFELRMPWVAFVEIICLWLSILASLVAFWQATAVAGWLMLPYLGWVTYAAALNFVIWQMNP